MTILRAMPFHLFRRVDQTTLYVPSSSIYHPSKSIKINIYFSIWPIVVYLADSSSSRDLSGLMWEQKKSQKIKKSVFLELPLRFLVTFFFLPSSHRLWWDYKILDSIDLTRWDKVCVYLHLWLGGRLTDEMEGRKDRKPDWGLYNGESWMEWNRVR